MGKVKVSVNQDTCIGCRLCAELCSDTFKMIDDKAIAHRGEMEAGDLTNEKDMEDSCPSNSIKVEE
jgi:ferredoxin